MRGSEGARGADGMSGAIGGVLDARWADAGWVFGTSAMRWVQAVCESRPVVGFFPLFLL